MVRLCQRLGLPFLGEVFEICGFEGVEVGVRDPGTEKDSLEREQMHSHPRRTKGRERKRDSQFICMEKHNGEGSFIGLLPSICVGFLICAIFLLGSNGTCR